MHVFFQRFLSHALPTQNSRRTFTILIAAVLIIQLALFFTLQVYWRLTPAEMEPPRVANELIRIVAIAKAVPVDLLKQNIKFLSRGDFHVSIHAKTSETAQQLTAINPALLRQIALTVPNFFIEIPLDKNQRLQVRYNKSRLPPWWNIGFIFLISVLFLMMLILLFWAIKRVTPPLDNLVKAVKRFGNDLQAPPLPEEGSIEMKTLSQAFNTMQQHIRKLLQDRTQMLAAISHDLRTPLTRLQLRAEYLQGTPQYTKAQNDIKEMEQMITSILFFARDDARSGVKERFDLNALLAALCSDMTDTGKAVHFQESAERIPFYGNINTLKRAFNNLIENAVKYGKEAQISIMQDPQTLRIYIIDQGPGIPQNEMEKVFEPFYRIDPARSFQMSGSGLGLAIARDIIYAHGGDITVKNIPTGGLCVQVSFRLE